MPVVSGWTKAEGEPAKNDWPHEWVFDTPVIFHCHRCGYEREFAKNETVYLNPECPHIDLACNAVPK